jgi:hypothetical protein
MEELGVFSVFLSLLFFDHLVLGVKRAVLSLVQLRQSK